MEELAFLQDLSIVMVISAVSMVVCRRIHLPVVLGYILAGLIIGPYTPPHILVTDMNNIHIMSDLGIIFLLFSIGLEFSFSKLMKVGVVAFFAATFEIIVMMGLGFLLGQCFGWNKMDSLFLGAMLSISSTTIIAKVLIETHKIKEQFAQVILGILIVEDLLAIVIIAILSGIAATGGFVPREAGAAMIKVAVFVSAFLLIGFFAVPRILQYVEKFKVPEMLIITVLGLCFSGALIAGQLEFSVALGAFLMGAIIAETPQSHEILHKIEPIRDMFTAMFFVSVGMLIQPLLLVQYWIPILILTLVTIIGKVAGCSLATYLTGYKPETAMKVGLGLAQIGEFSFIIAQLGDSTDVTSPFLYPIIVSISCITTVTTPLLMKYTPQILHLLRAVTPSFVKEGLRFYTRQMEKLQKHG